MVGALEIHKSGLGIYENGETHNSTRNSIIENKNGFSSPGRIMTSSSSSPSSFPLYDREAAFSSTTHEHFKSRLSNDEARERQHSDMELMKEKFAKLLLGEDMSGGGNGVSSALALSNAITNLSASIFGEEKKLQPMSPENKARWRKEIDWLLSVTDCVVEFVPSQQTSKDGSSMEIMVTRQRNDLHTNIPALRKLDTMLLNCLDKFKDQKEFYYASKDDGEISQKLRTTRKDDKWWIPTPKVPSAGLPEVARRWLQYQKDLVTQVLNAAMAINAQVLSEMEIPESYIESLPKNGRACLGESIYKSVTDEYFDLDNFLCSLDLSSDHKILDLKNRMEASVFIWRRKMQAKDSKTPWSSSAVSLEKRELFEERAENILLILKHQFPGVAQSSLDVSKIHYNRDVGYAILESYSRILESLAFTISSRIDDVLNADLLARDPTCVEVSLNRPSVKGLHKFLHAQEEIEKLMNSVETPTSMTLSEFKGRNWNYKEDSELSGILNSKPTNVITHNRISHIEKLEKIGGTRSPRI